MKKAPVCFSISYFFTNFAAVNTLAIICLFVIVFVLGFVAGYVCHVLKTNAFLMRRGLRPEAFWRE